MLQNGVIRLSFSIWSSPVVTVKKQDGSWRFCVDYRKLNSVTHRDAYPLPRIDSTHWRTTFQNTILHLQINKKLDSQHFEFNVMPFGLTNAPPSF